MVTFTVNTLADTPAVNLSTGTDANDKISLRSAIMAAQAGTDSNVTIDLTGVSGEIDLGSTLPTLTQNYTITGPAASSLMVRGNSTNFRLLYIESGTSSIQSLTLSGGNAGNSAYGGAIFNAGTLTLTGCTFQYNSAKGGGAIDNDGTLTASNCFVTDNTASTSNGGGFWNEGTMTLSNCYITTNNATSGSGGGVFNFGTMTIKSNSQITSNNAMNGGGVANGIDCNLTISDTTKIDSNYATASGGGIFNYGTLTMAGGEVSSNTALTSGGGIFNEGSTASFSDVSIQNNTAGTGRVGVGVGVDGGGGGGAPNGIGGGFYVQGGSISLTNGCILSGNVAAACTGGAWQSPGTWNATPDCYIFDPVNEAP